MKLKFKPSTSAVMCAVAVVCSTVLLAACGGGGGGSSTAATVATPFTVIDGPIKGAVVFMDRNGNGVWDTGEVKGTTDADGKVTLDIPTADSGKYPIIADVGAGAIDADTGVPLTAAQAYKMKAPADHTGVVSPLTTLVQHAIESDTTKLTTTASAVQELKDQTGIASPMANFVATATADPLARTVAKTIVAIKQSKSAELASSVGTKETVTSTAGTAITQTDIDALIRAEILKILPAIVTAVQTQTQTGGSCTTGMSAACQAAINTAVGAPANGNTAATGLVAQTTTTPSNVAINVGVTNAGKKADTTAPATTAEASVSLDDFRWSDLSNWYYRIFYASAAENNAVDANGMTKSTERRVKNVAGTQTTWTYNFESARDGDLHWDGAAWKNCADSGGLTAKNPDAAGLYAYSYCGGFTVGKQSRTTIDIAGKKFGDVSDQIKAVNTLWGSAAPWQLTQNNPNLSQNTFPAGSVLRFQTASPTATAVAYDPRPAITGNSYAEVKIYSANVAAGGDARTDTTHACRSTEYSTVPAVAATTLESLLINKGVPCKFNQFTVTNPSVGGAAAIGGKDATPTTAPTFSESWDNSTLSIGVVNQANNMATFGAYTSSTRIRVAFGTGNAVTYYACRERWNNSGTRECVSIGTGTYTITTLGDGRAMSFSGLSPSATTALGYNYGPSCTTDCQITSAAAQALTYDRVFVERGGKVYYGYKNKLITSNSARLNLTATNAIFNALGIPAIATPGAAQ